MPELRPGERVVQFGPDGRTLVLASIQIGGQSKARDQAVRLWDLEARKFRATLLLDEGVPPVLSPDGRLLATVNRDGKLHLWDSQTGKLRRSWWARRSRLES